jgi:superoxide dismutase, Fe-Mn family
MAFELMKLDYGYTALEPYIDARTMEIHHTKHHAAYTTNLNNAIKDTSFEGKTIEEILSVISTAPVAVRNNGGGFYNHNLFWKLIGPPVGSKPSINLGEAINQKFGSFDNFKSEFSNAAATRFGSGWAWLVSTKDGLKIISTPNQDNPLMDIAEIKGNPLLCLDVWEHAYYLLYQNRRADYIAAFWNIVNWNEVSNRFKS